MRSSLTLATDAPDFRAALREWFETNRRNLPWRRERSLYRTVVSEFMLQQTRVDTVLPYFERWTRELPDFETLAAAPTERVLKLWEGLGYYRRARHLHALAKIIAATNSIPTDAASWQKLPGVGPYTAAAIVSLAFQTPAACVDGNVVRILSRLTGDLTLYPTSSDAVKKYRPIASSLLDPANPGLHNEAMMELGATVCLRRKPTCLLCPVRSFCKAHAAGTAESLPRFQPKKIEARVVTRLWCRDNRGRLLLHQAAGNAKRLASLWELPATDHLAFSPGAVEERGTLLLRVKRSITRFSITESIFQIHLTKEETEYARHIPDLHWKTPEEIESLAFSGPHRRWIADILTPGDVPVSRGRPATSGRTSSTRPT